MSGKFDFYLSIAHDKGLCALVKRCNEYLIEFAYSTDWQYNVSDWAMVLTKSYMVYLPDDYDGLVFAAMPQLDNYKDCARRMQLDSIAPEASIMDIDLVDPYNTLFFSICY